MPHTGIQSVDDFLDRAGRVWHDEGMDNAAYCIRCHRDDLPHSLLCRREEITDLGADRDPDLLARYEGRCLRCCNHNHG